MPTPDQTRLETERAHPRIMQLWRALRPLTSVIRFMQSGAHPDDEISDMLAALAFRDGISLSYACSTRGEGGQNDIGTESGRALGALRTREMERACDVLGMRMYWHSETPEDPITDFGFSKSGDETLERWGQSRTVSRFVEIIRRDRPDILCPTFLDVSGQHGHHRAMTRAAHDVMQAAADPGFPCDLPPWQVAKLYLPAWSGAGQAYDDDAPPPPATLTVDGSGTDPVSGWGWARIGQMSRAYHRTQGMGRWTAPGERRDWPLHLAMSHVAGPDNTVTAGLPNTLDDLASLPGAGPISEDLRAAQSAIDVAVAAFPDYAAVAEALGQALAAVRLAQAGCPDEVSEQIQHRLADKDVQITHALSHALGIEARARCITTFLRPGERAQLDIETSESVTTRIEAPKSWSVSDDGLSLSKDAEPSSPYRDRYDPLNPPQPALAVSFSVGGEICTLRKPLEAEPVVLPLRTASLSPEATILNTARPVDLPPVRASGVNPAGGRMTLNLPEGWDAHYRDEAFHLSPPRTAADGLYEIGAEVDGAPAQSVQRIAHPHVAATAMCSPAVVRLRVMHVDVLDTHIGYIGAGNDRVDHWLRAMGADVTTISDDSLASDIELSQFDTLVIGIFAMRFRAGLVAAMPRLHRWTEAGGTLVTLYHRPWDNWAPDTIPPRRLEIGQPSLRWRVTNENAAVRHLEDHPVLSTPNRIGPQDWEGWVKERGLYFAKSWDEAYRPLLEMADPGEDPHQGSLLVADIGKGRHVHTSLILHHQMENLVPGAFRLMANMIARRA